MPSSVSLNQYAQGTNPSAQRLSQPLDTLEEGRELGRTPSKASESTLTQPEPSRLRKVKSAIQTKVPFWNSPSTKEKEKSPEPFNPPAQGPVDEGMNYTSDMVDVLDTLGRIENLHIEAYANLLRSRGCDPDIFDEFAKLLVRAQPALLQQAPNLQPAASSK